ncbi:MAG: hypothetical protein LBC59_08675 [Chitinispirillales bacterium]|jgi:hypothetical protein|nr:hypothetical protein [Chitinispirillales bacterium]
MRWLRRLMGDKTDNSVTTTEEEILNLKAAIKRLEEKYLPINLVKKRDQNIDKFYRPKETYLTKSELLLFEKLSTIIVSKEFINVFNEVKYFIFTKVKLIDIVQQTQLSWTKFKELNKNETVVDSIIKEYPDFNDSDYVKLAFYPILNCHIDFLICKSVDVNVVPILGIELNGNDHDSNKPKMNDIFKEHVLDLFRVKKTKGLMIIRNEELTQDGYDDKLKSKLIKTLKELS